MGGGGRGKSFGMQYMIGRRREQAGRDVKGNVSISVICGDQKNENTKKMMVTMCVILDIIFCDFIFYFFWFLSFQIIIIFTLGMNH